MSDAEKLDELAAKIMMAEKERRYSDHSKTMSEVSGSRDRLQTISGLAGRLPSGAFKSFFLCNLGEFAALSVEDYKCLYALSFGEEVALYNLTLCLVVVGGVRGERLRELSGNSSGVGKIEQFRGALRGDSAPAEDDRMFEYYQKAFGISKNEILSFRTAMSA